MSKKMTKEEIAKQKKRERDARYRAKKREAKAAPNNQKTIRSSQFQVKIPDGMNGMFHSLFTIISSHLAKDLSFFFRAMDIETEKLINDIYQMGLAEGKKAKCNCGGNCHRKGK